MGMEHLSDEKSSPLRSGLLLKSTKVIQQILLAGAALGNSCPELSDLAVQYQAAPTVPYLLVRDLWKLLRQKNLEHVGSLHSLLQGSSLVFERPKPREKSKELKERLAKLQEIADQKAYNELVKDVTGRRDEPEPFSSYKDQLGLGLHVIVAMFTGFAFGYVALRSQFRDNQVLHAVGGLAGLFLAMIVETLLFIINTSQYEKKKCKRKLA